MWPLRSVRRRSRVNPPFGLLSLRFCHHTYLSRIRHLHLFIILCKKRYKSSQASKKHFFSHWKVRTLWDQGEARVSNWYWWTESKCICPSCKIYISTKLQNVFVHIGKCICPNIKMYMTKWQNVGQGGESPIKRRKGRFRSSTRFQLILMDSRVNDACKLNTQHH